MFGCSISKIINIWKVYEYADIYAKYTLKDYFYYYSFLELLFFYPEC